MFCSSKPGDVPCRGNARQSRASLHALAALFQHSVADVNDKRVIGQTGEHSQHRLQTHVEARHVSSMVRTPAASATSVDMWSHRSHAPFDRVHLQGCGKDLHRSHNWIATSHVHHVKQLSDIFKFIEPEQ